MAGESNCQECFHGWAEHSLEVGCTNGWQYDREGVAVEPEGCRCVLANVMESPVKIL